ncbi:hypothetical protein ELY21_07145 [Legionella sp. km535]|uniref:hypothetical protein n=1 Tax=Legionella sp. km535 TaxID=2498107 RepID=UPI000F8E2F1A|nr:hypothetical protein [Legionella sp. km535]RUR18716.1 hypothetical protein ELY21_07145 [Legionella sp. km535]
MSKNALFNLINARNKFAHFEMPDNVHLLERTHKLGTPYFLFELPLKEQLVIGGYRLTNHHLSVYSDAVGKIDYKSQYHYTAYFEKEGIEYRLHVYFDSRDYFFSHPNFAEIQSENEFITVNCQEHDAAFTLLADTATRELVGKLRSFQTMVIKSLEAHYEELEARILVLSANIHLNKNAYIETIKRQKEVLNQIILYSNHPAPIFRKMSWLNMTLANVLTMDAPSAASKEEATSSDKAERVERKSRSSKKGTGYQATHFKHHTVQKSVLAEDVAKDKVAPKESFAAEIQQLKLRTDAYQSMTDEKLITQIEKLYLDVLGLEWTLESKHNYEVTLKDLTNLRILEDRVKQLGIGLLQRALIREHYEQAAQLNSFHSMLPETIALLALQNFKAELLDFLLKHKIIPINFKGFVIANKEYPSLVDYCFKNSTKEFPALKCLNTLVKHGVSLLDIESSSGLPYAAVLLLKQGHPLREVLEQNSGLTVNNPLFYKQLNQVLRLVLDKSTCAPEFKGQVAELILSNQHKIELLKHHIHSNESTKVPFYLEETLGEQMVRQLLDDPQIRFYKQSIERRVTQLIRRLPRVQHKAIAGFTEVNFELISNSLNRIENLAEVPSFEEIKRDVVRQQILILEFVDLRDEAIDKEELLSCVIQLKRKPTRDEKKFIARLNMILIRMGEIEKLLLNREHDPVQAIKDKASASLSEISNENSDLKQFISGLIKESSSSSSDAPRPEIGLAFGVFYNMLETARSDTTANTSGEEPDMTNICRIS